MRAWSLLVLALLIAAPAAAQSWRDPDLDERVLEGAADARFLWLRGGDDRVVRFDRASGERRVAPLKHPDLLVIGARIWALTIAPDGRTVRITDLRSHEVFGEALHLPGAMIGLFDDGGQPGVLTPRAVIRMRDGAWREDALPAVLPEGGQVAAAENGDLYYGLNLGEWGGGLRRIDGRTRAIGFVSTPSDELCGGLLNPDCEPVVGLFRDPARPACIITASGLAHLGLRHGAVHRVCHDEITPVFSAPYPVDETQISPPGQTWPFYSLTATGDGWIAVSDGRYFRAHGDEVAEHPLPELADWSGLRISAPQDGVLFVLGACCWGSANHVLFSTVAIPILSD